MQSCDIRIVKQWLYRLQSGITVDQAVLRQISPCPLPVPKRQELIAHDLSVIPDNLRSISRCLPRIVRPAKPPSDVLMKENDYIHFRPASPHGCGGSSSASATHHGQLIEHVHRWQNRSASRCSAGDEICIKRTIADLSARRGRGRSAFTQI